MTVSVWLAQSSRIEEEFDVVVVGGGVAGAAAAYWLGQKGNLATAVVDADFRRSSSARSAGFVLRGILSYYNQAIRKYGRETAEWIWHLNEETLRCLAELSRGRESALEYTPCGSYLLASSLEEMQDLEESAELMAADEFEVEYLRDDPLDRGYYGALHSPDDVGLNPVRLVELLLSLSGATTYSGEEVYKIEPSGGKIVVQTPARVIKASRVILLVNAFLPGLIPQLAPLLDVIRGQALVTRPLKESIISKLCYANYGYEYFRQLPDGRFLIGGCREPFYPIEKGYGDLLTPPVQTALTSYLRDRFPDVAGAAIDYRWAGSMAFTRDGLPIVGEVEDRPGVFFGAGCNGHGLGYSLALSKILVDVATDDAEPGIFAANRMSLIGK